MSKCCKCIHRDSCLHTGLVFKKSLVRASAYTLIILTDFNGFLQCFRFILTDFNGFLQCLRFILTDFTGFLQCFRFILTDFNGFLQCFRANNSVGYQLRWRPLVSPSFPILATYYIVNWVVKVLPFCRSSAQNWSDGVDGVFPPSGVWSHSWLKKFLLCVTATHRVAVLHSFTYETGERPKVILVVV